MQDTDIPVTAGWYVVWTLRYTYTYAMVPQVIGHEIPHTQTSFWLVSVSKGFCGSLSTVSTFMAEVCPSCVIA
jgi:fluoride ion exporter CrcB/FEX